MEEITFQSISELYERIKPALETKQREMMRRGYTYIKKEDIWNYLKEVKWTKSSHLCLYDIVNDILNTDEVYIDGYLKDKLNSKDRNVYFDEKSNES